MSDFANFVPGPDEVKTIKQKSPAVNKKKAETKEVALDDSEKKTTKAKKASSTKFKEDKIYLHLGKYSIKLKPDSGYRVLLKNLAKEGYFAEACRMLELGVDLSTKENAEKLVSMLMVKRDDLENVVRSDPEWAMHEESKTQALIKRAQRDPKAKKTLENKRRVSDGNWKGDIKEIISTCCGSYMNKNRNVMKFDKAGLTVRKYPLNPSSEDTVYVMMFPSKFVRKVVQAISVAKGTPPEGIPGKHANNKSV